MTEYVWAVDPHVAHLSFAFAALDCDDVEVESLKVDSEFREGQRLGLLDRQIRIYANQLRRTFTPVCVWVEQPSGRFRNLPLTYATGVIQAALFETLGCPVWTFPPKTWKQRTVGNGNATKQHVGAWVRRRDPDVFDEHDCDAYAMACAGRAMLLDRSWEAAA